jgi:hypothetical protein
MVGWCSFHLLLLEVRLFKVMRLLLPPLIVTTWADSILDAFAGHEARARESQPRLP